MPRIPDSFKKAVYFEKSGNFFIPAARMMYASLFTPTPPSQDEDDEKKFIWSVTALIPAGFDLSALEEEVEKLIDREHKPANAKLREKITRPFLETAGIRSLASLADEYPICLRLTAKAYDKNGKRRQAPGVVDMHGKPVSPDREPDETYNGRWFRASVNPYAWTHKTGGEGVSLGLVNAQLLWHDDPLAGGKVAAESEFEAISDEEMADLEGAFE